MSEAKLDQIVKGAPPPNVSPQQVAASIVAGATGDPSPERTVASIHEAKKPSLGAEDSHPEDVDPSLPSSPPQIYLNLLILEASLRAQFLTLHARRRRNTFFLLLLFVWILYFSYCLFLRPREDGLGVGGSPYWVVDMTEKMSFMGGIFTAVLVWGTGQWERGVRWPRRWVGVTNRGLRGMNLKIVVLKGPWWSRLLEYFALLFPYSSFFQTGSSYHMVETPVSEKDAVKKHSRHRSDSRASYDQFRTYTPGLREEDVASGGDYIKLLLLPKNFSAEFRENWELYRAEYWEKENQRRAELRKIVKKRLREEAKQQGGWLWWTGWRGWKRIEPAASIQRHKGLDPPSRTGSDIEKAGASRSQVGRKRNTSLLQGNTDNSRSSSRSSVAGFDGSATRRSARSKTKAATLSASTAKPSSSQQRRRVKKEGDDSAPEVGKRVSTLSSASSSDGELSDRSTTSTADFKRENDETNPHNDPRRGRSARARVVAMSSDEDEGIDASPVAKNVPKVEVTSE